MKHHFFLWLFGVATLTLAGGCGSDGRVPVHPVRGKVLVDGEPLTNGLVVFHPVEPLPEVPKPNAPLREDGTFALTTYEAGDGAPIGEYVVTVTWIPPGMGVEEDRGLLSPPAERDDSPTTDPTGGRYKDPETSELRSTVESGENELAPFNLE